MVMVDTNGMIIVNRIDKLLKERNENRRHLASAIQISPTTISVWSTRGTIPAADTALNIANYFGVSVEWLLTGRERDGLTEEERRLLDGWRQLDGRDREDVLGVVEMKLERMSQSPAEESAPAG